MPMLLDEMRQLSSEMNVVKKGKLPPLVSFMIGIGAFIMALLFSVGYVFPFLVAFFQMKIIVAMFITLGTFIVLDVFLGELATKLIEWQLKRVEEKTA